MLALDAMTISDTISPVPPAAATPPPELTSILADVFGFSGLREGQREAIDAVMAGRNVLAVMPTGAGKSLCYQLPALVLGGLTVVVSPLVALMRDQVAALKLNGVARYGSCIFRPSA